jgi:hypothetical protein
MELLLNLIWVLLAVPAFWLWRYEASPARRSRYLSPLRIVLVLGFVLLLLFPVISATDDLRAMQTETEESLAGQRVSRTAEHNKDHHQVSYLGASSAFRLLALSAPADQFAGMVFVPSVVLPPAVRLRASSGRAPPFLIA